MKTIHTVQLANGHTDKRESASRVYRAVVIATCTQATVDQHAAGKVEITAKLAADRAALAQAMADQGLTVEGAVEAEKAIHDRYFPKYWEVLAACNHNHDRADAEMIRQGYKLICDEKSGPYVIESLANKVARAQKTLASWVVLQVGAQNAVSWHTTSALAHAAARQYAQNERCHYTFHVITEIATRTVQPRNKGQE